MSTNEATATAQAKPELATFGHDYPEPGAYYLDLRVAAMIPLTENGEPSTFADTYRRLREAKILKISDTFETDRGEVTVSGEAFLLLRALIGLHRDGIDPERGYWFFYDHEHSRDACAANLFFLVQDDKIVCESLSFSDRDPRLLVQVEESEKPLWRSRPYWDEASEVFWYRKFYTETITGQLMVLRPDKPILYHYDPAAHDVWRNVQFVTLIKIYRLLWVAVPLLAAIAFPILRLFMAMVAAIAAACLLWTEWVTRKVGR